MESQNQSVTQGELQAALEAQDQRFQGRLDAGEQHILDRLAETVRESETRLLQAFYGFAESNEQRHRVLALEKRLNLSPAS
ncbi:MAG TPA: hypothetical protein VGN17_04195 [Bryobacteraceae bacterium]|jgi:hypothetical protein